MVTRGGLGLFLLLPAVIQAVSVTGGFDGTRVGRAETAAYQITVKNAGDKTVSIDFPKGNITNGRVTGSPSRSHSIEIINFRKTESVTYTYRIRPHGTGTLRVPSFSVGVDDRTYTVPAASIEVVKGRTRRRRSRGFFDFDVDRFDRPSSGPRGGPSDFRFINRCQTVSLYVGQTVAVDYFIDFAAEPDRVQPDVPNNDQFLTRDVMIKKKAGTVRHGGKRFQRFHFKRSYITPLSAGTYTLDGGTLQVRVGGAFGNVFEVTGRDLPLTVRPLPAAARGLPVGDFRLAWSLPKTAVQVNEPFILRLTVTGIGSHRFSPPELSPGNHIKVYRPSRRPAEKTEHPQVRFEYPLTAKKSGPLRLAPGPVRYFSPDKQRIVEVPGRTFELRAAPAPARADKNNTPREDAQRPPAGFRWAERQEKSSPPVEVPLQWGGIALAVDTAVIALSLLFMNVLRAVRSAPGKRAARRDILRQLRKGEIGESAAIEQFARHTAGLPPQKAGGRYLADYLESAGLRDSAETVRSLTAEIETAAYAAGKQGEERERRHRLARCLEEAAARLERLS